MSDFPEPRSKTLAEILTDLRKPIPPAKLKEKRQGGSRITFCPHYTVCDLLDYYAPGWEWSLDATVGHDRFYLVGTLTLHGSDGSITRSATGTETLKRVDKDTGEEKEHAYGDPSSNAEGMCLRRAAMKCGLGRDLWRK